MKRYDEIIKQMADIVKEFGVISNIPVRHKYYDLRNELQSLRANGEHLKVESTPPKTTK